MSLKDSFATFFMMGSGLSADNLKNPVHRQLFLEQYNSMTAENNMKPSFFLDDEKNLSEPDTYNLSPAMRFDNAVPFLDFARDNGIAMRGHVLVWHNQTPEYFFHEDYDEKKDFASREVMLARLESYIKGVLTFTAKSYPGLIYAWDVVNEAVDEGSFRKSTWYKILGEEFIFKAFEYARRYAEPSVKLFYNDYETAQDWKRDFIIDNILKPLIAKGLVDGMGMQSHLLMDHPDMKDFEKALHMYGSLGIEVQITELDMHNDDPSEESMDALAGRYAELFDIILDSKTKKLANVTCVTFWNLFDECSWLTGFRRVRSYPLLFTEDGTKKKAYESVTAVTKKYK